MKDFERFDIDMNHGSSFEIANLLWDKIAEGMQKNCV